MDWSWATEGITDDVPRTAGPDCVNYLTNRRRIIESIVMTVLCLLIIRWAWKSMDPIEVPAETDKPYSPVRFFFLILMTYIFGIEFGFKFAGKSVIFALNPCHIQTIMQIYLLAARPSKFAIALFRIQLNYANGPFLASLFPEIETRTYPFERCTYWIQHALLYIIPVYMLKSGLYKAEKLKDIYWTSIGVSIMYLYHFNFLTGMSVLTGINLNHMLCAALADPFQGNNYRVAAVIHESILCPVLNKLTVLTFAQSEKNLIISKRDIKDLIKQRQEVETLEHTIPTTKID